MKITTRKQDTRVKSIGTQVRGGGKLLMTIKQSQDPRRSCHRPDSPEKAFLKEPSSKVTRWVRKMNTKGEGEKKRNIKTNHSQRNLRPLPQSGPTGRGGGGKTYRQNTPKKGHQKGKKRRDKRVGRGREDPTEGGLETFPRTRKEGRERQEQVSSGDAKSRQENKGGGAPM